MFFFCISRGHTGSVSNCTFNKLERLYATCSWDKNVLLYDASTGSFRWAIRQLALAIHLNSVGVQINEIAFSDVLLYMLLLLFYLLRMSTVQLICIFSFPYYRREGPSALPKVHEGSVAACHMSDDGKLLVTGGYDLRVVLWDLENMTHKIALRVRRITFEINV